MPLPDIVVNRSSPVPLYFQVAEQLERAIFDGKLAPGDRIANEVSLAEELGLSRPTMRQAIQLLVDKGMLVRKRGVGTQVVQTPVHRPVELTSLFDDLASHHQTPTTVVLANEVVTATDEVAVMLAIASGSDVLHLRRLRYAHGEPLAIMENFLPADLIGLGLMDLSTRGMYQLMRQKGVNIRVAKQRIGARTGTPEECTLLGEKRGSPVLTMERAAHDDSGRPVEWGRHCYRASQYSFEVTLVDH